MENTIEVIKWAITTLIGIIGMIIGRCWVKRDKKQSIDTAIYHRIISLLPYYGMEYIRTYDFGGTIDAESHRFLHTFAAEMNNIENIFINSKIEEKKKNLMRSVNSFLGLLGEYTTPVNVSGRHFIVVPQCDDYKTKVDQINHSANDVYSNYKDFLLFARENLI